MNFFQNKLSGINRRINSVKYGMFYWRNKDYKIPQMLTVNGVRKQLKMDHMNIHEFTLICIDDCYQLGFLKKKLRNVERIVDAGANHGMFIIAARQFFPGAQIHCYEPNPYLINPLFYNAKQLNATAYSEAIMKNDCRVSLNFSESDLATIANESEEGNVTGSSLATVIKRIGNIDILKLDCEGAEWELLEDLNSWKHIQSLTMEYHLWGRKDAKVEDIFELLNKINFELMRYVVYNSHQGFVLAVNKSVL